MKIYFATNRAADPAVVGGFGAEFSETLSYGTASLDPGGGIAIDPEIGRAGWPDRAIDEIVAAGMPVFAIIHGFDYTMADALRRAGELGDLCRGHGADATVLAFCWPSAGRVIEFPDLAGSYAHDQVQARRSGPAIAAFLAELAELRFNLTGSRMALLCHSMGNFALAEALDRVSEQAIVFDEAMLAAADERWDSFGLPGAGRLGRLPKLATRQTIYFARNDAALALSRIVNGVPRLGQDGPQGASSFASDRFRLIDCTAVDPQGLNPDDSHQYYRTVPRVTADIAALVRGVAPPVDIALKIAA
jgi:esterase/lipase superfamily enzyme